MISEEEVRDRDRRKLQRKMLIKIFFGALALFIIIIKNKGKGYYSVGEILFN